MRALVLFILVAPCVTCGTEDALPSESLGSDVPSQTEDVTALETLAYACGIGTFEACDELWTFSDVGSEFERLGASCGGRVEVGAEPAFGDCVTRFGVAGSTPAVSPPTFDAGNPPPSSVTSSELLASPPDPTIDDLLASPPDPTIDDLLVAPESGSWIVILASLAQSTEGSYERALAGAQRFTDDQGIDAAVLSTGEFPSLNPGYWVVYVRQQYDDADAAAAACADLLLAGQTVDCYHRQVGDAVAAD